MDKGEIEKFVRASYDARRTNDVQATLAFFHRDAEFRIAGSPALGPMTKRVCGHGEICGLFEGMFPDWDWSKFHIRSVHVDGDTAFVYSAGEMRHIPTGKVIETDILDRLTIRDGLIADFTEFLDTHLVTQVLGPPAA